MGNSASNISSVVAPAAKANDPYVTQSYVDTNFLTNGNFTTYDNYMKGVLSKIPTDVSNAVTNTTLTNTLANYPTNTSLNTTLANSTLYCPPDQAYCSLSNTKAGTNSIVALNGNIGIGTTDPKQPLHINKDTQAFTYSRYTNASTPTGFDIGVHPWGDAMINHRDNYAIRFQTNGTERMRLSDTGNVGIGITTPIHRLDIAATGSRSGTHPTTALPVYITGNINDSSNGVEIRHSNGTQGIGIGQNSIYAAGSNANQNLNIIPKGTGMVGIGTINPSHRLDVSGNINSSGNITNSGNVGIGTTSPNQALHINRTTTPALSKYTNTNTANLNATTPGGLDVGVEGIGDGIIFHRNNYPIRIATNNTERMRISGGGNVGIGITTPIHRLDIAGDTRSGTHATTSRPVYITGDISDSSNGVEIRHSNGTQGIGFGFKSIYAAGSNNDQDLNIIPKGTGNVGIGTISPAHRLDVNGNINSSGNITSSGNIGIGITNPSQRLSIGPLTSSTDVIAMSLPNNWYIKMKGATIANPAGQLCFSNGSTATTSIDYVCIDPTKTS